MTTIAEPITRSPFDALRATALEEAAVIDILALPVGDNPFRKIASVGDLYLFAKFCPPSVYDEPNSYLLDVRICTPEGALTCEYREILAEDPCHLDEEFCEQARQYLAECIEQVTDPIRIRNACYREIRNFNQRARTFWELIELT